MKPKQEDLPRLGLLGLGSRSTIFYLKQLNKHYNTAFGADNTCPLLLLNANFEELNPYLPNQFERLEPTLLKYLNSINTLPIEQLMIPNITLHESYDRLKLHNAFGYKVIHPVKSTLNQLQQDGQQDAFLFGSNYSMNSTAINKQFNHAGINLLQPNQHDMVTIDNIRQLVYANKETPKDTQQFNALIERYKASYPVVVACTELSIAIKVNTTNIYDMAMIQMASFFSQRL